MVRILIVKPSSLGDVIHALPAVSLLRRRLGTELERLSWVVNTSFSGLLKLSPDVDRIICFPRDRIGHWSAVKPFLQDLRSESYDIAIDFQGLLRSGLISLASRAPRRVGFATGRECSPWFYTEKYTPVALHAVEKNLGLADFCFPSTTELPNKLDWGGGPLLRIPEEQQAKAKEMLGATDSRPVLAVGHSSRWNSKNWPITFFADVLDAVHRKMPETLIWLLGTKGECERAEAVRQACHAAKPLNLAGKSDMMGLVGLIGQSDALVTNDSGPMHLAAALNVPTIAFFGATNPKLTGPYGTPGRHEVVVSQCEKSPCFLKECPLGRDCCSRGVSVEQVAETIVKRLAERHTP